MLSQEIGKRFRELIRQICESMEIEIIKEHVSKDRAGFQPTCARPPALAGGS